MSFKKKLWLAVIAALFLSLVAGISIGNAAYLNNHPQTPNAVKLVDQSVNDNASSVVVFWLKGCPYCNKALPNIVKEANQHRTIKMIYVEINSAAGETLSSSYEVTKVPAMVKFSHGHTSAPQLVTTGNAANNTIHVNRTLIASFYKN